MIKRYINKIGFDSRNISELKEICQRFNDDDTFKRSNHGLDKLKDRFDFMEVLTFLKSAKFNFENMFEYYFENNRVTKLVFSLEYNETDNIKIVLSRNKTLVTAWINKKTDTHATLDVSLYTTV